MKKLMIAAAIVCAAVAAQAVNVKWTSSAVGYAIDPETVKGHGDGVYTASSSTLMMNTSATINYALKIYAEGTTDVVFEHESAPVAYGSTGKYQLASTATDMVKDTTYDYYMELTGYQQSIRDLGQVKGMQGDVAGTYDYTAATISWSSSSSATAPKSGPMGLNDNPASFQVSGITFTPDPVPPVVPEPTSAMLLLLGVAGLALKRKQA